MLYQISAVLQSNRNSSRIISYYHVLSCIIQYSENMTAARFSLRSLPPPGAGTRRRPEPLTMWCSFLGCTSSFLSSRQHHCTMVPTVNGCHVAPPGEKLVSLLHIQLPRVSWMRLSGTKQNAERSMVSLSKLPLGVTSRDVAYAAYCTYLLFFSEIPKGSCSSQGPVMQACFRRAACDG